MGFFLSNENAYQVSANYIKVWDDAPLFFQHEMGRLALGAIVK